MRLFLRFADSMTTTRLCGVLIVSLLLLMALTAYSVTKLEQMSFAMADAEVPDVALVIAVSNIAESPNADAQRALREWSDARMRLAKAGRSPATPLRSAIWSLLAASAVVFLLLLFAAVVAGANFMRARNK